MRKKILIIVACLAAIISCQNAVAESNISPLQEEITDEQAHEIVLNGTPEDVKRLIQNGYDVDKVFYCNTLLISAIKSAATGNNALNAPHYAIEKIKFLVASGADVNKVGCPGNSMPALYWAVSLPNQTENIGIMMNSVFEKKIHAGIGECNFPEVISKPCKDVTLEEQKKIKTSIHYAFFMKNKMLSPYFMEIITYLINNGAQIDRNEKSGKNLAPIHLALINPKEFSYEPLRTLIDHGANVDVQDEDGNTPLFLAYSSNDEKAVELLKNAGADVTIRNKNGAFYNEVSKMQVMHEYNGEDPSQEIFEHFDNILKK